MTQKGNVEFDYYTKAGDYLNVSAQIYYNSYGEQEIDTIELMDENGNEVGLSKLLPADRNQIEEQALNKCIPQDEVYDELESFEDLE
jgi:hypothetical protein